MKKILIALLLASSLLLGGCTTPSSDQTAKTTQGDVQETAPDDPAEDDDYLDLERRKTSSFQKTALSFHSVPFSVNVSLPEDWELTEGEDLEQIILRDGEEIGRIFVGEAQDIEEWKTVATRTTDLSGFPVEEHIEKYGTGETLAFRFRYYVSAEAEGKTRDLTLTVNYTEVDSDCAFRLLNHTELTKATGGDRMGDLAGLENAKIAILGNSFVNSSRVGSVLQEMLNQNGKNASVTAYSRGYATVKTYVEDSSLMSSIRNGKYDAIFLCGFYSASEVSNLTAMKTACEASGTRLILFPAHNEKRNVITTASNQNPSLYLMDWKQEVDLLIAKGVDKWEMCINDQHQHSTPMAGYVGAHMIYRAIYDDLPNPNKGSSYVSMPLAKQLLGDYLETGLVGEPPIYLD